MSATALFVGGLGPPELLLVFGIVILLFGAQKLPELARSSGEAMGEFKKGREDIERELRETKDGVAREVETMDARGDADAVTEDAASESASDPA
ncbi:MAG: twin-arginine translocase TatA/TatE family subunit [Halobacteriales archaeon]